MSLKKSIFPYIGVAYVGGFTAILAIGMPISLIEDNTKALVIVSIFLSLPVGSALGISFLDRHDENMSILGRALLSGVAFVIMGILLGFFPHFPFSLLFVGPLIMALVSSLAGHYMKKRDKSVEI